MVEDSNVKEETKAVIKARLEILNAAWEWILENCK